MLSLEYVKKVETIAKILDILATTGVEDLKKEIDINQEKYLRFVGKYFYGARRSENERSVLLEEFKQLTPLSNRFFKKYYRDIVRANAKMETVIGELRKIDLELTGLDKIIVISKQVEDYIFNMDEDDNFSIENINDLNNYLKEYIQTRDNLINLKNIYQSFNPDNTLPEDYKEIEISFYTFDQSLENYSSRVQSLKLIYEILIRLNNINEDSTNKMLVIRAEKESTEAYKLAGLSNIIGDFQFIIKEWIKDYIESDSHDVSHIVSFKIDSKIKALVEKNQINSDMSDKYYSVIKKSLRNLQFDKCLSIDINSEHTVLSNKNSDSFNKITEDDFKNIIGDKSNQSKTYNEIMVENKESSTLKKIESNLLTNSNIQTIEEQSPEDLLQRGITLMSLRRHSEALEYIDNALKLKPDYAEAYNYKAHVFIQLSRFSESIKMVDQAISLKANYREAYLNKGTALFMMGRHAEALIQYHKTVDIDKDYSEGYFNLGSCYMMLEDKKKDAIRAFTKALDINPNYPEALYNRACAYVSGNYYDECIRDLEMAVKLDQSFKNMLRLDKDFSSIYEYQKFKTLIA